MAPDDPPSDPGDTGGGVTPLGLAVGPDRTVYVLLGDRGPSTTADPAAPARSGLIGRVPLVDGIDLPADVLAKPVSDPSGIGLAVPTAAPGPASKV